MGAGGALGGARNTAGWTPRTDGPSYASAKPRERLSQTAGFAWAEGRVGGGAGGRGVGRQAHLHLHLMYRSPDSEKLLDLERLKDFQH